MGERNIFINKNEYGLESAEDKVEDESISFSINNPQTWRTGDIVDIGSMEEFNSWREKVILESIKNVIISLVGQENYEKSDSAKKFIKAAHFVLDIWLDGATMRKQDILSKTYRDDPPWQVLVDSISEGEGINRLDSLPEFKLFLKETGDPDFVNRTFTMDIVYEVIEIVKRKPYENITSFIGEYKGAYVLLTGEEHRLSKLSIATGRLWETDEDPEKRTFKAIEIRKEAYEILKREEEERGKTGLINHVLDHELAEIEHALDKNNVLSPHGAIRDLKYMEVLKVLRKRKYFHDLVT